MPNKLDRVQIKINNLPPKSKIESAIDGRYRIRDLEVFLIGASGREDRIGKKEILFTSIEKNQDKDKEGDITYSISGYYRDIDNPFGEVGNGQPFVISKAKFK
jgi:hypothetical protein